MKRFFALAAVALVGVLALPAIASAGNDVARGNGTSANFDFFEEFAFNAQSNFNGSEPSGHAVFVEPDQDPDQKIVGRVTCLSVIGNQATISGDVTDVTPGTFPGFAIRSFIIRAVDNTEVGLPDQIDYFFSSGLPPPPPSCGAFTFFPSPIVDGQIVVKDATS
jgi:hypothetical protein